MADTSSADSRALLTPLIADLTAANPPVTAARVNGSIALPAEFVNVYAVDYEPLSFLVL